MTLGPVHRYNRPTMLGTSCALVVLAFAQLGATPYRVSYALDGSLAAVLTIGAEPLTRVIPVERPSSGLASSSPSTRASRRTSRAAAAAESEGTLLTSGLVPLAALMGSGFDEHTGQAALVVLEAWGGTELVTDIVKRLVRRPRPYTYSGDPAVKRYSDAEGNDAYLSFFSGHSSMAFAAAVAGGYTFGVRSERRGARDLVGRRARAGDRHREPAGEGGQALLLRRHRRLPGRRGARIRRSARAPQGRRRLSPAAGRAGRDGRRD